MATKKKPRRPTKKSPARRSSRPRREQRQQPESLRLRSMAASLTVRDLEHSIAWYRDVLGFVVGERWEEGGQVRGVQMKAGACDLMLGQDDFAKGQDRKKGEGVRLWVATVQDIAQLAGRVKASGWRLDREPSETPWGDWAFALTDPDGFKLTIIQE
ncbi:MAG TPA: VOC family protein [Gemmatimonadales bacterium]|nr:VOC family protein [Gemmatimonadales bacterium]